MTKWKPEIRFDIYKKKWYPKIFLVNFLDHLLSFQKMGRKSEHDEKLAKDVAQFYKLNLLTLKHVSTVNTQLAPTLVIWLLWKKSRAAHVGLNVDITIKTAA